MGRASTDPTGTQTIATSLGISRRAVQKRMKKAREEALAEPSLPSMEQHTAPLSLLPTLCAPMKNPPVACRILWEEASARAGASEKMISRRLREALIAGDVPTARMMAGALKDIIGTIRQLEERAMNFYRGQPWLDVMPEGAIYSEIK